MKAVEEQLNQDQSPAITSEDYESGGLHSLALLIVFAKRKRIILRFTAGAAILALAVVLLIPNRYTATATIMPPQQTQSTASMMMSQVAGAAGLGALASLAGKDLGLKNPNDLFIGMLQSRTVEDAIINKFGLQKVYNEKRLSDTRKDLEDATSITSGKDNLIDVAVEDKDPKRSAEMANAYVDQLRDLTNSLAVTEAAQRRIFFEQQLRKAKDDLANAEVAMKETQQKTGMVQLSSQARAIIQAIALLRAKIAAKEVELQAMGSFATDQNPDYVLARQELAGLHEQLRKFERAPSLDSSDPLVATGRLPAVGLEYIRRFREVKYRETIFELLAKQYEAAKLDEAKEAAFIQVVDVAVPADKKSWPPRAIIVIVSVLVGILAGCAWAYGAEMKDRLKGNGVISRQVADLRFYLRYKDRNKTSEG